MKIPFLLALVAAASALAQDPPPPVPIHGIVVDKTTRAPIAGARVSAVGVGPSLTDNGGAFTISLPSGTNVTLNAGADGYQGSPIQLVAGQNTGAIEIALDRLAEIRGRLVDDETKKPVAGLTLALVRAGDRVTATGPMPLRDTLITPPDGSFSFKNLYRDDYYLRIQSTPITAIEEIPAKALAGENRDQALKVPDSTEGYGVILWPGEDATASSAPPLKVNSDVMDIGDIRLRRYKLHNLTGVLGVCDEGASVQVLVIGKNGGGTVRLADLDTKCGNGFRILNLPNGSFTLVAQGGPPRVFGAETIDGFMRSPLFLNLSTPVTVQIRIEVEGVDADKFPPDIQRVNISLTPESAPFKVDAPSQIAPNEYEARLFGNERYRMLVLPPPGYYLKALSYDGVASADLTGFTAVSGSLSTLRLVLSNHPGVVEVQAPTGSGVILWKDGARYDDTGLDRNVLQPVVANGKVRFTGLAPGKYHAFIAAAVLPTSQDRIDEALTAAKAVVVEEDQTVSVDLTMP